MIRTCSCAGPPAHRRSGQHGVRQRGERKLRLPKDFEGRLAAESFESLPLTAAHARPVALLPWHYRDPFDRMLVAQARAENLILLTGDDVVSAYGDFVRLVR